MIEYITRYVELETDPRLVLDVRLQMARRVGPVQEALMVRTHVQERGAIGIAILAQGRQPPDKSLLKRLQYLLVRHREVGAP